MAAFAPLNLELDRIPQAGGLLNYKHLQKAKRKNEALCWHIFSRILSISKFVNSDFNSQPMRQYILPWPMIQENKHVNPHIL